MIWQLRIQSIIMVTRLFEDGKVKKRIFSLWKYFRLFYSINVFNIGQMKVKNELMILEFVLTVKKNMLIIQYVNLFYTINQRYLYLPIKLRLLFLLDKYF
jgi:hypothetical protein